MACSQTKTHFNSLLKTYKATYEKLKKQTAICRQKEKEATSYLKLHGDVNRAKEISYINACRKAGEINGKLEKQYETLMKCKAVLKEKGISTPAIKNYAYSLKLY